MSINETMTSINETTSSIKPNVCSSCKAFLGTKWQTCPFCKHNFTMEKDEVAVKQPPRGWGKVQPVKAESISTIQQLEVPESSNKTKPQPSGTLSRPPPPPTPYKPPKQSKPPRAWDVPLRPPKTPLQPAPQDESAMENWNIGEWLDAMKKLPDSDSPPSTRSSGTDKKNWRDHQATRPGDRNSGLTSSGPNPQPSYAPSDSQSSCLDDNDWRASSRSRMSCDTASTNHVSPNSKRNFPGDARRSSISSNHSTSARSETDPACLQDNNWRIHSNPRPLRRMSRDTTSTNSTASNSRFACPTRQTGSETADNWRRFSDSRSKASSNDDWRFEPPRHSRRPSLHSSSTSDSHRRDTTSTNCASSNSRFSRPTRQSGSETSDDWRRSSDSRNKASSNNDWRFEPPRSSRLPSMHSSSTSVSHRRERFGRDCGRGNTIPDRWRSGRENQKGPTNFSRDSLDFPVVRVSNLDLDVTQTEVRDLVCEKCRFYPSAIDRVYIPSSGGCAYVTFSSEENVQICMDTLHRTCYGHFLVTVQRADTERERRRKRDRIF